MKGSIGNIFITAEKITENQILTDTVFNVFDISSGERKVIKLTDEEIILAFKSVKGVDFSKDLNFINKNAKFKNIYVIINDSIGFNKSYKKLEKQFPIYYCDTSTLPFNNKKLLYPYSVLIKRGEISKISLGNVYKLLKEE